MALHPDKIAGLASIFTPKPTGMVGIKNQPQSLPPRLAQNRGAKPTPGYRSPQQSVDPGFYRNPPPPRFPRGESIQGGHPVQGGNLLQRLAFRMHEGRLQRHFQDLTQRQGGPALKPQYQADTELQRQVHNQQLHAQRLQHTQELHQQRLLLNQKRAQQQKQGS